MYPGRQGIIPVLLAVVVLVTGLTLVQAAERESTVAANTITIDAVTIGTTGSSVESGNVGLTTIVGQSLLVEGTAGPLTLTPGFGGSVTTVNTEQLLYLPIIVR